MTLKTLCASVLLSGILASNTFAASFNTNWILPATNPVDISVGTDDWAYFGFDGSTSGLVTKSGGFLSFSPVTGGVGTPFVVSDGRIPISFTGGTPTGASAYTTNAVVTQQLIANPAQTGASITFSTTLFAPDEQIQIYLFGYQTSFDFSATLSSGGNVSLTNQTLIGEFGDGDGTLGSGHTFAILDFVVTDATIDDVLTFTLTSSPLDQYGFIGVQAATATAISPVPEPAGSLLIFGAGALFLMRRRRLQV